MRIFMNLMKMTSWFELFTLHQNDDKHAPSFWKNQSLSLKFDTRKIDLNLPLKSPWKSFYYENQLRSMLQKVDWNSQELSILQRLYWKRNGNLIEKLTLHAQSVCYSDILRLLPWLTELKVLELYQTNRLLQTVTNDSSHELLTTLHTVKISDVHLVSKNVLTLVPKWVKKLEIRSCRKIDPNFFEALQEYDALEELILESSGGVESPLLCKLPKNLKRLDLSNPQQAMTTECLELLPKNLEELRLNNWTTLTDKDLVNFSTNLHTVELDGCRLSSQGLRQLGELPLKNCSLRQSGLDDFSMGLAFLPKTLVKLDISKNDFTLEDLAPLGQLHNLKCLVLEATNIMANSAIHFPSNLQELSLENSGPLSKGTVQGLKKLHRLKKLNIAGCHIENEDIEWLPDNLEELDLSNSTEITDTGVSMMQNLTELENITLDHCEGIRGFGLVSLADSVKKLSLAGCHRLSGKCLVSLPPKLEELYLDACELLVSQDTRGLPETLQVLQVTMCPHITSTSVGHLSSLPHLHTLEMGQKSTDSLQPHDSEADLQPSSSILKKLLNILRTPS
jgi:hypothetical protein